MNTFTMIIHLQCWITTISYSVTHFQHIFLPYHFQTMLLISVQIRTKHNVMCQGKDTLQLKHPSGKV